MKAKRQSCKVNYALLAIAYLEVRHRAPANPRVLQGSSASELPPTVSAGAERL